MAADKEPDLILITETWLNKNIQNCLLEPDNYYIEPNLRLDRCDTVNGIGGGVIVYARNGLAILPCDNNNNFNQYCSFYTLDDGNKPDLKVTLIYHSPNSNDDNTELLCDLIEEIPATTRNLIIGDFNFPHIKWDTFECNNKTRRFVEVVNAKSLQQVITFPTHIKGNILDLAFIDRPEDILNIEDIGNLGNSDHSILSFDILSNYSVKQQNEKVLDWNKADYSAISRQLIDAKLSEKFQGNSVIDCWNIFSSTINDAVEKNVPKKNRVASNKPVWINRRIIQLSRQKKRRYKVYCLDKTAENLRIYKDVEKRCKKAIRNSKRKFEKKLAMNKNMKPFNSYVKSKTKQKSCVGPLMFNDQLIYDNKKMADILNDYFVSVFNKDDSRDMPAVHTVPTNMLLHQAFTVRNVLDEIDKLKPKNSCGPDGISSNFIKRFKIELAPPLTIIFNKSLESSTVPEDWKVGNVCPIFKKGSKGKSSNYRPISMTSVPCKILESLIKNEIIKHIQQNNLLNKSQHGFTNGKSCSTNLLEFFERIISNLDDGIPTDVIYLDFAKAFDKVPISKLLHKVRSLNIDRKLVQWISEWLTKRKQRVVISGCSSEWADVLSGVPQGSVLGPILFLIFINDIDNAAETIELLNKFADDTKAGQSIRSPEDNVKLQNALNKLFSWSETWGMKFNIDKCKVLHFGKKNQCYSYEMNGVEISKSEAEKDLGIWMTRDLKPSVQCAEAYRISSTMLNQLSRAFHYRDRFVFLRLYKTYVRCHLEFSTPVWSPWLKGDIDLLEKVQEKAVNMISGLKAKTYTEKLKELNLLSLADRRTRFDVIQVFKIIKGIDKVPFNTWFDLQPGRSTRGSHNLNIQLKFRKTDVAKNFFSVRAAKNWNELPSIIKDSPNLSCFKKHLDKHMFGGLN